LNDDEGMPLDSSWTTSNGIDFYKTLVLHKCTEKDRALMYPANKNYAGQIDAIFPKLYCIDPKEIELQGNFNTDYAKIMYINLSVCEKKKTCRNINELQDNLPFLITITNSQRFE
jgi:hypothetical protein